MIPRFHRFPFVLFMLASISLAGCGSAHTPASTAPADEQDRDMALHADDREHAHPESFAGTLTELDELCAAIKTAFAAGDFKEADGPVHAVGHLLGELPELAAKESASEANRQQVKQAVETLMGSFAALDERVHGGGATGKSYDEVASEIDEALATLKAIELPEDQS